MLNKAQISIISLALLSLIGLYLFTDNYKLAGNKVKKDTSINSHDHVSDIDSLISLVLSKMTDLEIDSVKILTNLHSDNRKLYKTLSSFYYRRGHNGISAYYLINSYNENDSINTLSNGKLLIHLLSKTKEHSLKHYISDKVESIYNSIIENEAESYEAMYDLANLYIYEKGEIMPGVQMLLGITRKKPDFWPAQYQLSILAIRSGQYDKAITRLENLNENSPNNMDILLNLGKAYFLAGQKDRANEYFNECKKLAKPEQKDMINHFIKTITNA